MRNPDQKTVVTVCDRPTMAQRIAHMDLALCEHYRMVRDGYYRAAGSALASGNLTMCDHYLLMARLISEKLMSKKQLAFANA